MQVAVGDEAWYGSAARLGSVLQMPASRPPRTEARREDRRPLRARPSAAADGAEDGGGAWGFYFENACFPAKPLRLASGWQGSVSCRYFYFFSIFTVPLM